MKKTKEILLLISNILICVVYIYTRNKISSHLQSGISDIQNLNTICNICDLLFLILLIIPSIITINKTTIYKQVYYTNLISLILIVTREILFYTLLPQSIKLIPIFLESLCYLIFSNSMLFIIISGSLFINQKFYKKITKK